MSLAHQRIKNDPRWKAARLACFERDGWACVDCGATAEELAEGPLEDRLQADHVIELHEDDSLALEVDNLLTRCGRCNRAKHRALADRVIRHQWISPAYPEIRNALGL